MRKSFLLATVICFLLTTSFTPIRPSIDNELTKVERLYLTCKIWGFLKYYHPLVGKGSFDWDDKLQKVLANTNNIKSYESFSAYAARWIYNLGPRGTCKNCRDQNQYEPFLKNFDLSWTQDRRFGEDLRGSLKDIERNRFQGDHHYIGKGDVQQFEPKNEELYYDLNWEDENQRLLPLFRYWNYIEYFYPYKYQMDQQWDDALKELIQTFLAVESQLDLHLAMLEMVVKVDDSHAGLITSVLDQMPYYNYLPAKFELIENKAVITEIIDTEKSRMADLQIGDVIVKVNNQSVQNLHDSHRKYIWGSNDAVKDRSIYHTLFMGITEPPQVTIQRNGTIRNDKLTLYKYSDISYSKSDPQEKWKIPSDSIGYVNMGELSVGDVDNMMNELMDMTVIIFDIRNQPRGTYKAISNYLNPSDTTFAIYTKPDFTYPGKFMWQGGATCGNQNKDYFKGKVILLVDENTQDHAEFTAMCLQTAPDVTVIGSQTAGTDGRVSKFAIYARYYTSMTGMGVFYPNKQEAQRVGIVPDIKVEPTIASVRAGRDEVLEKAMEVAKEEVAKKIAEELARLEQARLDSFDSIRTVTIQMDSLRMDSLRSQMIEMDSLATDSLKVNNDRNR